MPSNSHLQKGLVGLSGRQKLKLKCIGTGTQATNKESWRGFVPGFEFVAFSLQQVTSEA
jgi:hypothetical protein